MAVGCVILSTSCSRLPACDKKLLDSRHHFYGQICLWTYCIL